MNLNTGFFPPHGQRRKQLTTAYHFPSTNHHIASLQRQRSSIESTNMNESFFPAISNSMVKNDDNRPYRRNDFANNHLFLAKRKLAGIFLEQPARNLQATSDLMHLFDQQRPKRKKQNLNQPKQQRNLIPKTSPDEQDIHLSVVNLVIESRHSSAQIPDPLSTMIQPRRRSQIYPPKVPRSSIDSTIKSNLQSTSLHTFTDENDLDEYIDNETVSDSTSTPNNLFDSSILCIKSIIPSIGPQPTNHHLLQHR